MLTLTKNLDLDRYDYARQAISERAAREPIKTIFDVGPGDGRMAKIHEKGFEWYGFDREAWGNVRRWDLIEPFPYPEQNADIVLLLEVIEHLPNPGLALKHIAGALRDGGYLILTTPNAHWSGSRINFLFRGVASGFSKQDLEENHHVFTPWTHILERFLCNAGLRVEEFVTLDGWTTLFRADGKLFLPARYLLNIVTMGIEALDPYSKGMSIGLIAKKVGVATDGHYVSLCSC
jgi:SAM-dependent methyltransferase